MNFKLHTWNQYYGNVIVEYTFNEFVTRVCTNSKHACNG